MSEPIELVRQFCAAWGDGTDVDSIVAYFADDAVYHNIPVDPVTGREAIKATIAMFTTGVEGIEFVMHNIAAHGDIVMTERVDIFRYAGGKTIELPVMGTFEVRDGKIVAWRDYFDLNQYMSQLQA